MTEYKPLKDWNPQPDLYNIDVPFGTLPIETRLELYRRHWEGEELEYLSGDRKICLSKDEGDELYSTITYRLKRTVPPIEVKWELFDKRWRWVAVEEDGEVVFSEERPVRRTTCWVSDGPMVWIDPGLLIPGVIEINEKGWKKTLTKRPEGV